MDQIFFNYCIRLALYVCLPLSIVTEKFAIENSYTLEKLTEIALEKSEIIQAKLHEIKSIQGAANQVTVWKNPLIAAGGGAKTEGTGSGFWYELNITQPFYYPGKQNLKAEIQESLKKDKTLELEQVKRHIFYQVIYLAFSYNEAIEHASHLDERSKRFRIVQRYLNSRPFVSPQERLKKNLVKNRIFLLEKEILEINNKQKIILEKLNLYLGLKLPIQVKVSWFIRGIHLKLETLRQNIQKNPVLLAQKALMKRKNLQVSLARREKYPDFSLSGTYAQERVLETERLFGGKLTFALPLWNRNQGKITQRKEELAAITARTSFLEKEILAKINTAYLNYEKKRTLIQKYPIHMLKTLHKQMGYIDKEFRKGRIEVLSYFELEESSSQIHETIFEAQVEYLESYLKLLDLTGSMNFQEEQVKKK